MTYTGIRGHFKYPEHARPNVYYSPPYSAKVPQHFRRGLGVLYSQNDYFRNSREFINMIETPGSGNLVYGQVYNMPNDWYSYNNYDTNKLVVNFSCSVIDDHGLVHKFIKWLDSMGSSYSIEVLREGEPNPKVYWAP